LVFGKERGEKSVRRQKKGGRKDARVYRKNEGKDKRIGLGETKGDISSTGIRERRVSKKKKSCSCLDEE